MRPRLHATPLLPLLLTAQLACGDDPPCEKSGPPCTTAAPPTIDARTGASALTGLGGDESFIAYGENNVYWSSADGRSLSLHLTDPYFTSEDPRELVVDIELVRDVDGDSPGCFVKEHILPICVELGSAGGSAVLQEKRSPSRYYFTEGGGGGTVSLLGFSDEGELLGSFEMTLYLQESGVVIEGQKLELSGGRFSAPKL